MQKNIPTGWEEKPLIDFCEKSKRAIVDGPFGSNLKIIHYRKSGVPIITSGYVTDGVFKAEEYLYVDEEKFQQEIRSKVQSGDIVMAKIGARCGASAIMPEKHPVGLLSGNALKITVDEHQNSTKYVWYYLDWLNRTGKLAGIKAIGAQPAVSVPALKKLPILRPPQNEQNRIVEILSSWDRTIETLVRLIDTKTKLKKGLMQKMLTGKIRFRQFNEKWKTAEIGDLLDYEQPVKYLVDIVLNYAENSVPVLTANKSFILGSTSDKNGIYTNLPAVIFDDFTTDSKYVDFPFKVKSSAIKILRPKNAQIDLRFVYEAMKIVRFSSGAEHKRYFISEFQYLTIDVPSFEEQTAIGNTAKAIDSEINGLKKKLALLTTQKTGLIQKLLTGKIRVRA